MSWLLIQGTALRRTTANCLTSRITGSLHVQLYTSHVRDGHVVYMCSSVAQLTYALHVDLQDCSYFVTVLFFTRKCCVLSALSAVRMKCLIHKPTVVHGTRFPVVGRVHSRSVVTISDYFARRRELLYACCVCITN